MLENTTAMEGRKKQDDNKNRGSKVQRKNDDVMKGSKVQVHKVDLVHRVGGCSHDCSHGEQYPSIWWLGK